MRLPVRDVERLKKQVRKLAAGRVLAGEPADVGLDLGLLSGCRVRIAAGYGSQGDLPRSAPHDRLIWILDGYAHVETVDGHVTNVSQGESTILAGETAYRLVFPQLTIYLSVEAEARG